MQALHNSPLLKKLYCYKGFSQDLEEDLCSKKATARTKWEQVAETTVTSIVQNDVKIIV